MKKILVALDPVPASKKMAKVGHDIAKALGAQMVLLHVTSIPTFSPSLHFSPIIGFDSLNNEEILEGNAAKALMMEAMNFLFRIK